MQESLATLKAAVAELRDHTASKKALPAEAQEGAIRLLRQVLDWEGKLAELLKQPLGDDFTNWSKTSSMKPVVRAKVTVQSLTLLSELTLLNEAHGGSRGAMRMEAELHELQTMAIAVAETHKANLLIVAAATSITASVAGAAAAVTGLLTENAAILSHVSSVSGALVGVPALIAVGFTTRQEYFNNSVRASMKSKLRQSHLSPTEAKTLRQVIRLCNAQSVINTTRISASLVIAAGAILAAVSGPGATVVGGVGAGLGGAALAANLYVRFGQTYRLPTDLPGTLVNVYRAEIQALHDRFIGEAADPSPAADRAAWAAAADAFLRDRHFEQSIGRDRTASIRQIIEGGMQVVRDELEDLNLLLSLADMVDG